MKARKKLLALTVSATLGITSLALGVHCLLPQDLSTVKAEDAAFTVTNLEDLVDAGSDVKLTSVWSFASNYTNSGYAMYTGSNDTKLNQLNIPKTAYEWAMYTETSDETHVASYKTDKTETVKLSANDYAGNYSVYANVTSQTSVDYTGLNLYNEDIGRNTVVSFNINYTGRKYVFVPRSEDNYGTYASKAGYDIRFNHNKQYLYQISNGTTASYKRQVKWADYVTTYNTKFGTTYTGIDDFVSDGDILNVTYGAYDTDTTTYIYFRLYNVTKDLFIVEENYNTNALDNVTTGTTMRILVYAKDDAAYTNRKSVTIAGVNEPLLQNGYDTSVATGDYTEGDALSTVTLPTGYTWKDGAQTLLAGANEYDAVYAYKYYGNKTQECKVSVTAKALPNNTVTIKDVNGDTIAQSSVKEGENYTFTALENREKTFVAYKANDGAYYNVDDVITPESNVEYTLVEVDFALNEKVSVRMHETAEYYGGLRYTAQMTATDYNALDLEKVSIHTMIIPSDLIDGELDVNEKNAETKVATISDLAENKVAMFALTNIRHFNYDRQYSGMAYLQIAYADGDIAYVKTNVMSVSAYDLALESYGENARAILETSVALYSSANLSVLERYINGVVDLTYSVADGEITSVDFAENGLDLDKGYTLENWQAEENTVTVTLNIANSVLETLLVDGESVAPVVIRRDNGAYTAVNATHAYDAGTNVLTLTFTVNA